jgi:class 3 adenylate cyclase
MSKHKSEISNRKSVLSEAELSQIEQVTAEYDWETVRDLINQALAGSDLAPVEEFDLRKKLAKALDRLGEYDAAQEDIRRMIALARSLADDALLANALNMLAFNQLLVNEFDQAAAAAEEARSLAIQLQNKGLEARALNMLGWANGGDPIASEAYFRQALAQAENGASPKDESWALRELSRGPSVKNDFRRAEEYNWQSVQVTRASGDRYGEVIALHYYAHLQDDLAKLYYYLRQAFELARVIDIRGMVSMINNTLAGFYWRFGLAQRAVRHAKEAVRHQRNSRFLSVYLNSLDTLAFMARSAGDFELARESYEELIEGSRKERNRFYYYGLDGLGRLALDEGNHVEALSFLQEAVAGFRAAGIVDYEAISLTWLAAATLASNDSTRALELIRQALALVESEETFSVLHPRQEIWWQYYRILAATDGDKPTEERWHALEQACLALFEPVANIGDEGLRRNYFNKPPFNRAISEAWAREATRRDISLAPFTERETTPAALAEQLQHIVESGARLATERDVDKLADFILQEFIELSGVERAMVGIRRPGEPLQWASTFGFDAEEQQEVATMATPFIERTSKTLAPLLVDSAGEAPQGDVSELHLRSAIALPMISQGRLWGVLYGDMRHLFGRLNENDRDVLSLLANQAGAALENANWVETLEQQVTDRTAEAEAAREEAERANKANEDLLNNVLPKSIAARLKKKEPTIADGFQNASILFADLAGFTPVSQKMTPDELVKMLDAIFSRFDELVDQYGLEKIKTIGDEYMVASGIPIPREDHAQALADFALAMRDSLAEYSETNGVELRMRIGINSGPVVAGVIGKRRFLYDLWGDSVNTASRMESHGIPGEIQVTEATRDLLDGQFTFIDRGLIDIKGKGPMQTYLLRPNGHSKPKAGYKHLLR